MQPGRQALIDRRPPAMRALVDAAKQGNARRVSELLDDPSAAPYVTWAAYAAAATGGVAVTKVIAEKCGDATLHDREHLALRLSARRGDLDMFKMLLDTGSLLAAKDRQALRLAALHRHDAIISEGWRRGFPLWTIEELVAAARADRVDRVRWILSDPRFTEQSWRVAFAAVDAGAVGVIRMLAATRPSALHDRNHLALRMAARAGRLDVFQALLGSGSEPAARGGQALALARLHGHRRIARICENRGAGGFAPATVRDLLDAACSGDTARVDELIDDPIFEQHASRVGIAAAAGGAVEVVELLIRRLSAQVLHHRDHLALRIAARRGDLAIVDVLLANHSEPRACREQAMRLAAIRRHDDVIERLVEAGVPIFRKDELSNPFDEIRRRASGPVVFLHIAKTAGSSIGSMLMRTFPVAEIVEYDRAQAMAEPLSPSYCWHRQPVAKALGALTPAEQSAPRLLAGHFSYRIREVLPPSRLYISMIRHPIDRLVSGLYYGSGVGKRPTTIDDFRLLYDWDYEIQPTDRYLYMDSQVRTLSGDPSLDPDKLGSENAFRAVTDDVTDQVLAEAAENFILLGITERYEESMIVLARQLGVPLTLIIDRPRNRTEHRPRLDEVPAGAITALTNYNRQDLRLYAGANRLLDRIIEEDRSGFERDREILARLKEKHAAKEGYPRLLAYERAARGMPPPRLFYPEAPPRRPLDADRASAAYLDLMEDVLVGRVYQDPSLAPWNRGRYMAQDRQIGSDWPSRAHSMIGKQRMHNVRMLCEQAVREGVRGDFLEAGVWRGGATIMMRAVLHAHADRSRTVWVADSFTGVPPPDEQTYPADTGDKHHAAADVLAISQAEVASNFRSYGLLDRQVRFLPGLFKDTLAHAPIERLSVLRLDGDLYESTMDTLVALYDKVSPDGFIIVDDYGAVPGCKAAIEEFRKRRAIAAELVAIDWAGVYWRKPRTAI